MCGLFAKMEETKHVLELVSCGSSCLRLQQGIAAIVNLNRHLGAVNAGGIDVIFKLIGKGACTIVALGIAHNIIKGGARLFLYGDRTLVG